MNREFGCIPWDVPPLTADDFSHFPFCDGITAKAYKKAYEAYQPNNDEDCDCPPDCELVTFTPETSTFPMNEDSFCEFNAFSSTALTFRIYGRSQTIPGSSFYE